MSGRMIYKVDPWLEPFKDAIDARKAAILDAEKRIAKEGRLCDAVNNHLYYGLHRSADGGWVLREWAPNATRIYLIGDRNNWHRTEAYAFKPIGNGNWELSLPEFFLNHSDLYKLYIEWTGGGAERLPSYVTRVVQDPETKAFCAQVWEPRPYVWKHRNPGRKRNPLIYECHIGMSSEEEKVASFEEFRTKVLPRIKALGYNVIQIMALQEHPYYGSFGYQVSNFFALSSRFGTPEEFKALVDDAHAAGIAVVMDMVQSHSVDNEAEGLSRFDGTEYLYFHSGDKGRHPAWGSRCFNYGKDETRYFLLSNLKYWMEEYHLDGFRFDGVTSMIYWDHGLERDFGDYQMYFNESVDNDALVYLALANILIHELNPAAITIAEDMSAMPGLAAAVRAGGIGFDFRMSMGVADHWIKWIKEKSDEQWSMGEIGFELTRKRAEEKTISYAECHDQAMVGDKTIIFRLMDKEMYFSMGVDTQNPVVDRGVALHKLIRLATLATAGDGYLNFMGNEFGHPEWIDFPREGNGWSYKYARRQWSLSEPDYLRYKYLRNFDEAMIKYARRSSFLRFEPEILRADEEKKILIIRRGLSIFAFNFNPTESYQGYGFEVEDGKYRLALDSDRREFDGFSRLVQYEEHLTVNGQVYLYLPSRCVVVLEKV